MSSALNTAIYNRLAGVETLTGDALAAQQALAALLGTDVDPPFRPAVFLGAKDDSPVIFPRLTFRPNGGSIDGRFALQSGIVDNVEYDFEIWENTRRANTITDIGDQVERLLDMRRVIAPLLPLSVGKTFWMEAVLPLQVLYDQQLNAWFGLWRLRVVEARY